MKAHLIATAAAMLMTAGSAYAAPVSFSTPINVPNTFDGVYINLLTGATGTSGASVAGWDVNPYNSSSSLSFFWNQTTPSPSGGVAGSTTGPYLDLAPGATVSSGSIFTAVTATAGAFHTAGSHTLGFRFFNESTNALNYGYMTLVSGAANGFPLAITGWTFENTGQAITVPNLVAGVPEPGTWAMMIFGMGAVGSIMRRRKKVAVKVSYAA